MKASFDNTHFLFRRSLQPLLQNLPIKLVYKLDNIPGILCCILYRFEKPQFRNIEMSNILHE